MPSPRSRARARPLLHEVERLFHLVENGQGQDVYLGEAGVLNAVLVPVHDVASIYRARSHRRHFRYGCAAENHAAHMLAERVRRADELRREFGEFTPAARVRNILEVGQQSHLVAQRLGVA